MSSLPTHSSEELTKILTSLWNNGQEELAKALLGEVAEILCGLKNYSLVQTAKLLGGRKGFLEENLDRFEHQRIGRSVAFSPAQIQLLKEELTVRPAADEPVPAGSSEPAEAEAPAFSLASIRPSDRSRRRSA